MQYYTIHIFIKDKVVYNTMERKTTSIKINPEIWDKFKIYAIKKKIDMSEILEEMIEKLIGGGLKK